MSPIKLLSRGHETSSKQILSHFEQLSGMSKPMLMCERWSFFPLFDVTLSRETLSHCLLLSLTISLSQEKLSLTLSYSLSLSLSLSLTLSFSLSQEKEGRWWLDPFHVECQRKWTNRNWRRKKRKSWKTKTLSTEIELGGNEREEMQGALGQIKAISEAKI